VTLPTPTKRSTVIAICYLSVRPSVRLFVCSCLRTISQRDLKLVSPNLVHTIIWRHT